MSSAGPCALISTRMTSDDPVAADSDVVSWGQEPPPGPVLKFIRRGGILAAAPGLRSTFRVGRFQLCLAIHPAKDCGAAGDLSALSAGRRGCRQLAHAY